MQMDSRRFGIEFEFKGPWGGSMYNPVGQDRLREILDNAGFSKWEIGNDGSEFEVTTPPISGAAGFKSVKRFLSLLKEIGCKTTDRDGLHVHFDAPEFVGNRELVTKLVSTWMGNVDHIGLFVHSRRHTSGATPRWRPNDFEALKTMPTSEYTLGRHRDFWGYRNGGELARKDLNIKALGMHGTIEIRLHEGTLDYETVFGWVRFGQSFINGVLHNDVIVAKNGSELLNKIKVSKRPKTVLRRRQRELNNVPAMAY